MTGNYEHQCGSFGGHLQFCAALYIHNLLACVTSAMLAHTNVARRMQVVSFEEIKIGHARGYSLASR